jgi:hypothetical protein
LAIGLSPSARALSGHGDHFLNSLNCSRAGRAYGGHLRLDCAGTAA